jgi:beta-lactamase regulating signal transducer with metallopeptidase domain
MITYIIQVILFQAIFLAIYDFFLSKETFFSKNRWYLLGTSIFSFIIPFVKIPTFQKAFPQEFSVYLPEIVLSPQSLIEETAVYKTIYESTNYISTLFFIGISTFLIIFFVKLGRLIYLINKHKIERKEEYTLILLPHSKKAFSFFNYIFLGDEIKEGEKGKIIHHELVHSKQKHTFDLMLFELLKIGMWFNPLIYIYQKRISLVHEYLSDSTIIQSTPKEHYINNLLLKLFDVEHISFINQFYKHSFIKKRIIMITKTKSRQTKQLKFLYLIPAIACMLFYLSFTKSENTIEHTTKKEPLISVNKKDVVKENIKDDLQETDTNVPFTIIETPPTFPGCDDGDKKCFTKKIQQHVAKNFDSALPKKLKLPKGKQRLVMNFVIDKDGDVGNIKVKSNHEKLKEEARRVIGMLPKMKPGKQRGKKVGVKFALPMRIDVD